MIYAGAVKYGNLGIECRPCIITGQYFMKDNVLIVTDGMVIFKYIEDETEYLVIVTKNEIKKIKLSTVIDAMRLSKNCGVVRV